MSLDHSLIRTLEYLKEAFYNVYPKNSGFLLDVMDIYWQPRYMARAIIEKLEQDYKVIEIDNVMGDEVIIDFVGQEHKTDIISFKFTDKFETFYNDNVQGKHSQTLEKDNRRYWITYSEKHRRIILNDSFIVGRPDCNSNNDVFFSYLYKNANRDLSTDELEKNSIVTKRGFHKMLDDLGFSGKLKELFFGISKNVIVFHNPITEDDMKKTDMSMLRLSDLVRNNPK